jgi:hypothetical protein
MNGIIIHNNHFKIDQGQNYLKNDDVSIMTGQDSEISNHFLKSILNLKSLLNK